MERAAGSGVFTQRQDLAVEHLAAVDDQRAGAAAAADEEVVGIAEGIVGIAAVEDGAVVDNERAVGAGAIANRQNVVADGQ